jgi:pimeloyl-ACP methyl ester carboxylesterase
MNPRGHGDSSAYFNRYGDEATASDFLDVIRRVDRGRAVLTGCSFGAAAATIAAAQSPELVAGIILLGPFLRNGIGALGMWLMPLLFWKP